MGWNKKNHTQSSGNKQGGNTMKKMKWAVLSLALVGVLAGGNAMAAGSATVNVSAAILGTCSIGGPYTMAFGVIDPIDTVDKTATADLAITCTNGTPWTLTGVPSTSQAMTGPGTLSYTVSSSAFSGTGTGSAQAVTLTGTIAQLIYKDATPGVYNHSFTVAVNP
jgi:spore coat protein U-like protein